MSKQLNFFEQTKETWLINARMEARRIARERGEVCADDIHQALPLPAYIDRRIMGSVFEGMQFIRYQKSRRRECHHRPIGVFGYQGDLCSQ